MLLIVINDRDNDISEITSFKFVKASQGHANAAAFRRIQKGGSKPAWNRMSFFRSRFFIPTVVLASSVFVYYQVTQPPMPTLAAVRASNAAFSAAYLPVGVFVGGTSGIGQGLAESFARATKGNAQIYIIGRNKAAAEATFAKFPKPTNPNAKAEFISCDVSLLKNVGAVTKELLTKTPKVNFLVMTPGYFATKGRDESEEGIDRKLAVHYYSRFKFTKDLIGALEKAKGDGEDAKVLTVLAATKGGEIDLDDLGLKKGYTVGKAASQGPAYNDVLVDVSAFRLLLGILLTPCSYRNSPSIIQS